MVQLKPKVTLKAKGEEAYVTIKQLVAALRCTLAVDLDLQAYICNQPNSIFASYNGKVTVKSSGHSFEIPLIEQTPGSYCIIAHVDNSGTADPMLINVNKVQSNQPGIQNFLMGR